MEAPDPVDFRDWHHAHWPSRPDIPQALRQQARKAFLASVNAGQLEFDGAESAKSGLYSGGITLVTEPWNFRQRGAR